MINIAIVEDNYRLREYINSLINKTLFSHTFEYCIYQYESSEQFLEKVNIINHHVLLLDIELPGISGIDLAQVISKQKQDCIIIFLTSYEHYMRDAFGINVYRYIMKNECDNILPTVLNEVIDMLGNKEERIFNVPVGVTSVLLENVVYIEYLERNPYIILEDHKKIRLSATSLRSVWEYVNSKDFIQINNHIIINMCYITEIAHNKVWLNSMDSCFEISRGKIKETLITYQNYLMKGNTL